MLQKSHCLLRVGQKYPNQKNFRVFFLTHLSIFKLAGSKMTQSWLYEGGDPRARPNGSRPSFKPAFKNDRIKLEKNENMKIGVLTA
ncbi:hypothetical protein BpHYR1_028551 [Brachionus plicatilis]|uniref:Uncharacterized protein n=1 Tax=Brachionus plicatilis TaxID=10195 RepID=A0A3M7Q569_BRAPC|nr:hypothetical protein BpHYR1_028551 [Brachionus plicatilis]